MTRNVRLPQTFAALMIGVASLALPNAARAENEVQHAAHNAAAAANQLAVESNEAMDKSVHGDAHGEGHEEKANLLGGPAEGLITGLTTLIVFLGLVVVLGKYAWGPISGGLKAREDKIRRDIEEAESARARAEATLRDYQAQLATAEQKVRDLLAKANTDAEQIAANIRTRAQEDAQSIKENATKEIDGARRAAIRDVHEQAAVLATNVAEKILRRSLNADDQRDLVASSLDQLKTINN